MEEATERRATRAPISCPHCKAGTLRREAREGFLENKIYPKFGLYPWSCYACRKRTMVKDRGAVRRKRSSESSTGSASA